MPSWIVLFPLFGKSSKHGPSYYHHRDQVHFRTF